MELRAKAQEDEGFGGSSGLEIAGSVVENVLKSGDISPKSISKGITKAVGKKSKGVFGGMIDGLLDDIGIRDIQDEFIEIGNEFREEFDEKKKELLNL